MNRSEWLKLNDQMADVLIPMQDHDIDVVIVGGMAQVVRGTEVLYEIEMPTPFSAEALLREYDQTLYRYGVDHLSKTSS